MKKKRRYTLFRRAYMGNSETACIRVHDASIVPALADAFRRHTGYKSNGASLDDYCFQWMEIRCSKHLSFPENRDELRKIWALCAKSDAFPTFHQ